MPNNSQPPRIFDNRAYNFVKEWFDSEDVIAGLSLPMIHMLTGRSPLFRDFIMGFVNQIISRNGVAMLGGGSMSAVTLHSVKSLVAGALVPLENYLFRSKKLRTEGFFNEMSRATVASLVAGATGSLIGESLPEYL